MNRTANFNSGSNSAVNSHSKNVADLADMAELSTWRHFSGVQN